MIMQQNVIQIQYTTIKVCIYICIYIEQNIKQQRTVWGNMFDYTEISQSIQSRMNHNDKDNYKAHTSSKTPPPVSRTTSSSHM